jgi:hypothetical protein
LFNARNRHCVRLVDVAGGFERQQHTKTCLGGQFGFNRQSSACYFRKYNIQVGGQKCRWRCFEFGDCSRQGQWQGLGEYRERVYHKGGRWYGKTKAGKFMTESEAKAAGYKAAHRE